MATFKEQEIEAEKIKRSLQGHITPLSNPVAKARNECTSFWNLPCPAQSHLDMGKSFSEYS